MKGSREVGDWMRYESVQQGALNGGDSSRCLEIPRLVIDKIKKLLNRRLTIHDTRVVRVRQGRTPVVAFHRTHVCVALTYTRRPLPYT